MNGPIVMAATWNDGVYLITDGAVRRELAGRAVKWLASDGRAGTLAIVDGHAVMRRSAGGAWHTIAVGATDLACCVAVADRIYVGTDDARPLLARRDGMLLPLAGFDAVPGRETWYAGSVVVDGETVGPPLGIRSMAATCDGAVLLANVHVGGVPRSTDRGATWEPTIDIDVDVHDVRAHPWRAEIIAAAAAAGLCVSRDGGVTWTVEQAGLDAPYCSAIAFAGDDVLVAASTDHFAARGAMYRRPIDADMPLALLGGGFPRWMDGIADTGCVAAVATGHVAVVDRGGNLYRSADFGSSWSRGGTRIPAASSVLIQPSEA